MIWHDDEPKRVELTEAEIDALLSVYQSPSVRKWPRLLAVVADIVTAREADAETRESALPSPSQTTIWVAPSERLRR